MKNNECICLKDHIFKFASTFEFQVFKNQIYEYYKPINSDMLYVSDGGVAGYPINNFNDFFMNINDYRNKRINTILE